MEKRIESDRTIASVPGDVLIIGAAATATILLCAVPLTFWAGVYRIYTLPRFVLLITGSAILATTLGLLGIESRVTGRSYFRDLKTTHVLILVLYTAWIACSSLLATNQQVALFGSFENQMGFLTRGSFLLCSLGLLVGIGRSQQRLETVIWSLALTGLAVGAYGVAQFFGLEPFVSSKLYTSSTSDGALIRIASTIGHADYLGNFLLYSAFPGLALAIISRGQARRIALAAALLILAATLCSGTRGAWLGLIVGLVVFVVSLTGGAVKSPLSRRLRNSTLVIVIVLIIGCGLLAASSRASRNIIVRLRSTLSEGMTGSGRTLLWRDAIKMVPQYALIGCGPEGFRTAFLPYKSKELGKLAPQTNNESSHNSYLDAAICFGLPGLVLYVAVIASSMRLLIGTYRRAPNSRLRVIGAALFASLTAVSIHNIFIFDQIPTGFYFFGFAGLAQVVHRIALSDDAASGAEYPLRVRSRSKWLLRASVATIGVALTGGSLWYGIELVKGDREIKGALAAAEIGDLQKVTRLGGRAADRYEPSSAYDFLFAQALAACAERLGTTSSIPSEFGEKSLRDIRASALSLASVHARKSLERTPTPDSSYLLLAYLSLMSNDADGLRTFSAKALEYDPQFANARWLRAEAYLADRDYETAQREARLGLELNPFSRELKRALKAAYWGAAPITELIAKLMEHSRRASDSGNAKKADQLLFQAADLLDRPCPDCHARVAIAHEKAHRYAEAIVEWREFLKGETSNLAKERVESHITTLARKAASTDRR